jgi:hypothetical protein
MLSSLDNANLIGTQIMLSLVRIMFSLGTQIMLSLAYQHVETDKLLYQLIQLILNSTEQH